MENKEKSQNGIEFLLNSTQRGKMFSRNCGKPHLYHTTHNSHYKNYRVIYKYYKYAKMKSPKVVTLYTERQENRNYTQKKVAKWLKSYVKY